MKLQTPNPSKIWPDRNGKITNSWVTQEWWALEKATRAANMRPFWGYTPEI